MEQEIAKKGAVLAGVGIFCLLVLLYVYQVLIVPILVSCFLAFLFEPLVVRLERVFVLRGVAVLFLITLLGFIITVGSIKFVPMVSDEIVRLIRSLPQVGAHITENWLPTIKEKLTSLPIISSEDFDNFVLQYSDLGQMTIRAQQVLINIWQSIPQVIGTVFHLVLIPFFMFFLLKDYRRIRSFLVTLVPVSVRDPLRSLVNQSSDALRGIVRGQLVVASVQGVMYVIGLSVVGLQNAFVIGVIAGVCRLIPYLDIFVGGLLSLVAVLSDYQGTGQLTMIIVVFAIVQIVDGVVITPRVLGGRIGVHPMVIIASIISFGELFGFWGVVGAVPAIAVAKLLFSSAFEAYKQSKIYSSELPPGDSLLRPE